MTQALNVEYEELKARAGEIEQALPSIPATNPAAPCALSFVNDAAVQLALSADSMRLYLKACEREWKVLAKSLRNAAKAYEEVDEGAAEAIGNDASTPGSVGGNDQMMVNCDPDEDFGGYLPPPSPPPPPFEYPYFEVREAAAQIEAGDQGTAFRAFAQDWDAFQREVQKETYRFRPFSNWEGEARAAVEQNFEQQRQWIYAMASLCSTLASQAKKVADAHKVARVTKAPPWDKVSTETEHPTTYEVSQCDYWYKTYVERKSPYLYMAIDWYQRLQEQSERALANYISNGSLPLAPVNPRAPVTATVINPPPPPPAPPPPPKEPDFWDRVIGDGLDDNLSLPNPTDMPSVPAAGGLPSTPTADTAAMTDAVKDALKGSGPPTGGGMKPASLGGGGHRRCHCSPRWTPKRRREPPGQGPVPRAWAACPARAAHWGAVPAVRA